MISYRFNVTGLCFVRLIYESSFKKADAALNGTVRAALNLEPEVVPLKPDVIDQLFSKYYNEALLYCISLCRNCTVAEDIVSGAFLKALTAADNSISSFKAWLLAVCRNEYISMCRKNSRMTGREIPEDLPEQREEMLESIIRREEYRSLYRAIGLLPQVQKEAVTLFYFNGLQVRDVAQVIGKSETNTKVLLYRARENLKNIMEDCI